MVNNRICCKCGLEFQCTGKLGGGCKTVPNNLCHCLQCKFEHLLFSHAQSIAPICFDNLVSKAEIEKFSIAHQL